jgi:hypothetical protein
LDPSLNPSAAGVIVGAPSGRYLSERRVSAHRDAAIYLKVLACHE